MMNSAHPVSYSSKLRAFLGSILCGRQDTTDDSNTQEEPLAQHVPTHAAKSFLRTATPRRSLRNQAKAPSLDLENANDVSTTVSPPAKISNTGSQAASLSRTALHWTSTPWVPSSNFDTPYPNITERHKSLRDGRRALGSARNSTEVNRSRLGHTFSIYSYAWERKELHINTFLGLATIHAARVKVEHTLFDQNRRNSCENDTFKNL